MEAKSSSSLFELELASPLAKNESTAIAPKGGE
jgi:hypothetical protein